ncbi:hypothetical protein VSWAT3_01940 [Vibrionales bacterium SWAT-3]|nr:hypothetical protein VSWAT3_01940 [Vibrionales bacterium SWAT-3]
MIIAKYLINSNVLNLGAVLFMELMGQMYFRESALNAKVVSLELISNHNLSP